jgi:hypothetical protein
MTEMEAEGQMSDLHQGSEVYNPSHGDKLATSLARISHQIIEISRAQGQLKIVRRSWLSGRGQINVSPAAVGLKQSQSKQIRCKLTAEALKLKVVSETTLSSYFILGIYF